MDENQALVPINETDIIDVTVLPVLSDYDDALYQSGQIANQYAQASAFADYHEECSANTKSRQKKDLEIFSNYLQSMGVNRSPSALYDDPYAWQGVQYGHLKAFKLWQKDQGYAIGSINVRLATVRKYCSLAFEAKVIPARDMDLIRTVKGYSHKRGVNVDIERKEQGIDQRKGEKKASPTYVSKNGLRTLRSTTIAHDKSRRDHDRDLALRDALLVALLTEHGLRCGEIVALNIESFNLETEEITVKRPKTDDVDIYPMMPRMIDALTAYLPTQARTTGPLFLGYAGKRISRRTINARIGEIGALAAIPDLSPHDLRHTWTINAFKSGNSIDVIQGYGGWKSAAMPLHYAKVAGVKHEKLKLTD